MSQLLFTHTTSAAAIGHPYPYLLHYSEQGRKGRHSVARGERGKGKGKREKERARDVKWNLSAHEGRNDERRGWLAD